ncbi:hypothetical protein J6590_078096 [Homalodisca vitripennis]|nr:hypothetical protein J6590_078096 [Homalodisca vitripennis]
MKDKIPQRGQMYRDQEAKSGLQEAFIRLMVSEEIKAANEFSMYPKFLVQTETSTLNSEEERVTVYNMVLQLPHSTSNANRTLSLRRFALSQLATSQAYHSSDCLGFIGHLPIAS